MSELLGVSTSNTAFLLKRFKWNSEQLTERFFEDPEKMMASLPSTDKVPPPNTSLTCAICGCDYVKLEMKSLDC
jgi:hypothetical protein